MAGKVKNMSEIKQLLIKHQQGKGIKTIAKELGISKNTVKSYINKLNISKLDIKELLMMENPVLEAKFFAGSPSYKEYRYEELSNKFEYYVSELKKTGVTRRLLWEEYLKEQPNGYRFTQFCHHLHQYQKTKKPTMVLTHKPGEKLFIDFAGKKLSYIDKKTGEVVECEVFVACLPYSDYCFAMAIASQKVEDFIYALTRCLETIGGVPQTLVPDNLKSAIVKANKYEPDVNKVLEDFANHYQIDVTPARSRKPQDKALVENQVRLVYSRVYAKLRNQQFFDLHSLNQAITQKVKEHNQTKMQQKDYCREEKYLSDEKPFLRPLPVEPFEIKYYKKLKVAKNNHILLFPDKHYYSVPYENIGLDVKVIFNRSMVCIYSKGEPVATHIRNYTQGGYSTIKEHLCSAHQHYLDRSPDYYIKQARGLSEVLSDYIEAIFKQAKHAEQLYRTCDGLLSLFKKSDKNEFEAACRKAKNNGVYSYKHIKNMIENKMTADEEKNEKCLPKHTNTRGSVYYS